MRTYEKPTVVVQEDFAEGVYAYSGSNCWTVSVTPNGNNWWHLDAHHICTEAHGMRIYFVIKFSGLVTVTQNSGYTTVSGNNTDWVVFERINPTNGGESVGFNFELAPVDTPLTVISAYCVCKDN